MVYRGKIMKIVAIQILMDLPVHLIAKGYKELIDQCFGYIGVLYHFLFITFV